VRIEHRQRNVSPWRVNSHPDDAQRTEGHEDDDDVDD
jgi:hypothetical protein